MDFNAAFSRQPHGSTASLQEPKPEVEKKGIGVLGQQADSYLIRVRAAAIRRRMRSPGVEAVQEPEVDALLEEDNPQNRWLLTTCVAGVAVSLIIGSAALGMFARSTAPLPAYAAVDKASMVGLPSLKKLPATSNEKPKLAAYQPAEPLAAEEPADKQNYPEISTEGLPYGDGKTIVLDAEITSAEQESENITTISMTPPAEPVDEVFRLAKGETLIDALSRRGVAKDAAEALAAALEPVFPAKLMKEGTSIELTLDRQQDFYGRDAIFPVELAFKPGPNETIRVLADEDGRFVAGIAGADAGAKSKYADGGHYRTKAKVGSSLYATAKDHGVPDYIVAEMTRVFAYDVDFQRQVKADDSFELFYGSPLTGSSTKRKVLHYAQLTLGGKAKTYYRYTTGDGQTDYFDERGQSATKALLKTPVSGARLTSGFGMRRHPLLGYSKMHAGVDFGAPSGTPIRAAGSGTVEIAGRHGAYGVTAKIKHNGKYETLYAHMSKLAPGIRRGARVNQGQIIGYVGSTGRSTGPHLHYEVRIKDRAVNPNRIQITGGKSLADKDLMKFRLLKQRVLAMMQTAPVAVKLAQASQ